MKRMNKNTKNVDEYIDSFPLDVQKKLKKIRKTVKSAAPKSEETIKYGIPTIILNGNLVHFAGYKTHIGFYPGSKAIVKFKSKLSLYETAKGTIRLPLDKPLPLKLIKNITSYRVKENMKKAKK